jgi:hypothetical protein
VNVRDLAIGPHTVEATLDGYAARTERVTLTAATTSKTVTMTLQPLAKTPAATQTPAAGRAAVAVGSMYLDSRPPGARIFLDGKDVGKTPLTLSDIKVGSHPLRFELAGYKTLNTTVTVRAGQQERVTVTLEQALVSLFRSPNHHITKSPN